MKRRCLTAQIVATVPCCESSWLTSSAELSQIPSRDDGRYGRRSPWLVLRRRWQCAGIRAGISPRQQLPSYTPLRLQGSQTSRGPSNLGASMRAMLSQVFCHGGSPLYTVTRAFHGTCVTRHNAAPHATDGSPNEAASPPYNAERHIEAAEATLREMYGPQAKLVLHRQQRRRRYTAAPLPQRSLAVSGESIPEGLSPAVADQEPDLPDDDEDGLPGASQAHEHTSADVFYRASATFRLLAFPVELAVATAPSAQAAVESCVRQALRSNITFIRPSSSSSKNGQSRGTLNASNSNRSGGRGRGGRGGRSSLAHELRNTRSGIFHQRRQGEPAPGGSYGPRLTPHQQELKAIMEELRQLCVHFSRSVKFSIKPPVAGRETGTPKEPSQQRGRADGKLEDAAEQPSPSTATPLTDAEATNHARKQWRCRCYVKEEWSTIAQARLAVETRGSSPNDALVQCVTQLRQAYKEELESPAVQEEGVREVADVLLSQHKTVKATCMPEAPGSRESADSSGASSAVSTTGMGSPAKSGSMAYLTELSSFSAHITVQDRQHNTTTYTARKQVSPYTAYESAAATALRAEALWDTETHILSEGMPAPPLLWRMRWQFQMLLDHICRETGQTPAEVAWIEFSGDGAVPSAGTESSSDSSSSGETSTTVAKATAASTSSSEETAAVPHSSERAKGDATHAQPNSGSSRTAVPLVPRHFTGSLYSEQHVLLWQTSGGGRYRVEFDTYVQALYHLLDQYGDCLSTLPCMAPGVGEHLLFPSASVLELHVHRHDNFNVVQQHHGNLTCYALLGTLTTQLLGCPYAVHYHYDAASNDFTATLTVNDGRVSNQPLIQRRSKKKGEAWRFACLDAMRENFPRQYSAILNRYPEIDLAGDVANRSQVRALPREKRIPFFQSLPNMVMTLAEEDLGWRQPRVRLRNLATNLGLPQWTAELEAQVDGEEGRRAVAVSAAFPQAQLARRSLIFRLAKQYFSEELAVYEKLRRSDIKDPELDTAHHQNRFFNPNSIINSSLLSHVVSLMQTREPTVAPIRIALEARVRDGSVVDNSAEAALDGSDAAFMDRRYVQGDTALLFHQEPLALLRPPKLSYKAQILGNRGDVLIADFDSDSATTAADAQAVPVLVTALKSASFHLAKGDAETLWTEYETAALPGCESARTLSAALFNIFFGSYAEPRSGNVVGGVSTTVTESPTSAKPRRATTSAGFPAMLASRVTAAAVERAMSVEAASPEDAAINANTTVTVITAPVMEYWFGTAVLPRFGMLPIARAVATNKRRCIRDALILAARHSFPRVLQYAVKHDLGAASLAADILTEPIVEQLPPSTCRDLLAAVARQKRQGPLPPFRLLVRCTREAYPLRERFIRVLQTHDTTHGFQYRLYLQRGQVVRPGDAQLVGYGASPTSAPAALHRASIMALENLYEAALSAAVAAQPNYREPSSASTD